MSNTSRKLLLGLSCLSFLSLSCTTTKPAFPQKFAQKKMTKAGDDREPSLEKVGLKQNDSDYQDKLELSSLYLKLIETSYEIQDQDVSLISKISTPPSENSLEEAVLTLGNLKFVHRAADEAQAPETPDGGGSNHPEQGEDDPSSVSEKATSQVNLSIESQFEATQMDLVEILSNNPLLQDVVVYQIIDVTLSSSRDGESYRNAIADSIQQKITLWQTLADDFGNSRNSSSESMANTVSIQVDPSNYLAGDLLYGDSILMQAKKFASKGSFKQAILKARIVKNNDPYYPEAIDKIKFFSNLAVQDLRQKAARAFQSSLPVVDIKTKAAYLVEAKNYLEEALTDFPAADHLTTVKENLAVITKDLETISEERSSQ